MVARVERHERAHVVRIRQAEVVVEAVIVGEELGLVAEVPLADDPGGVAALLEDFRNRDFVRMDALRITRH